MILLLDNYDSFAHNLARYVRQLSNKVTVVRNDKISIDEIAAMRPERIIISPGPKGPEDAGICLEVVNNFAATIPILGVCLGHQVIAAAFGAAVVRAKQPMHGKSSVIYCEDNPIFEDLPPQFRVARYHSLIVDAATIPDCLQVVANTAAGEVMTLTHKNYPVVGLQFHPESVLTEHGYQLLNNFLAI